MRLDIPDKIKIQHNYVSNRIRILAIAIFLGMLVVFVMGIFTRGSYIHPDYNFINYIALGVCVLFCLPVKYVKLHFLKKANKNNFMNAYFNAIIIPLGMCDFGGLFCISTNLFVNENIIIAGIGLVISGLSVYVSMPKESDLDNINF